MENRDSKNMEKNFHYLLNYKQFDFALKVLPISRQPLQNPQYHITVTFTSFKFLFCHKVIQLTIPEY